MAGIRKLLTVFPFIFMGLNSWNICQEEKNYYRKWLTEDVIYIVTAEERAVFERLTTDEERDRFIEQFWKRRDTDPQTAVQEFKEEHYRRIAYANEHFKSGRDGWRMDRGRIYITFGPPDSIERHPTGGPYVRPLVEGGGTTTTYPFEVWHYRHIEGVGSDIDIEFVDPAGTGEYRIALRDTEKDALFTTVGAGQTMFEMEGLETRGGRLRSSDLMRGSGLEGDSIGNRYSNPFLRLEKYVNLQRPPTVKFADLKAVVESNIVYDSLPFNYASGLFRHDDSKALVPVTVEVKNSDLVYKKINEGEYLWAIVNIYGRVETLNREIAYEFEDVMAGNLKSGDSSRGVSLYQRLIPLGAGRYKLRLVVENQESGRIGTSEGLIVVGRLGSPGLSTSSIVLADWIAPAGPGESLPDPFMTAGGFKVYPNVRHEFVRGSPLGTYLEIYGAATDGSSGLPAVEVTYEIADSSGSVLERNQVRTEPDGARVTLSMLWPQSSLFAGKYRLRFLVQDRIAGEKISVATDFSLVERN